MKYSHKTLKNGLQIVTVPMPSNQTATVMVLVETGSDYETKENNGISHFLEHMCFKGTEKRTVYEINEELDSLGAVSNAFTWKEYTGYYAKGHYKHTEKMLDVVADIYLNSTLPEEEMKKEKGVIIEEINMYEDEPRRSVDDVLEALMYGDQPAGRTTLGPKKNIRKMTRDDFMKYRNEHYVAKATTIVVAGNVNTKDIEKQVQDLFKNISKSKKHPKKKVKDTQKAPQVAIKSKKTDQAHFILGFRGLHMTHKDRVVADLLLSVLGKGMSSRLFKKMRDELGLCYYVSSDQLSFTDYGIVAVSAGVAKKRLEEAVEAIVAELNLLKHEIVSPKELKKAKEHRMGTTALGLESSNALTGWFGLQAVHRVKIEKPEDYFKALKKITAEDIKKTAQKIFVNRKANLAVVSDLPKSHEKKLKKLLSFS